MWCCIMYYVLWIFFSTTAKSGDSCLLWEISNFLLTCSVVIVEVSRSGDRTDHCNTCATSAQRLDSRGPPRGWRTRGTSDGRASAVAMGVCLSAKWTPCGSIETSNSASAWFKPLNFMAVTLGGSTGSRLRPLSVKRTPP